MTKKERYQDKNFIMACDMPSELFTVKGIRSEYRTLAKIWHPDISDIEEALFIMSKINALYNEGLTLIEENRFYEKERLLKRKRQAREQTQVHVKKKTAAAKDGKEANTTHAEPPLRRSRKKRSIELRTSTGKCVRFKYLKRIIIELGFMYISEEYILLEITKLKRKIYLDAYNMVLKNSSGCFDLDLPNIIDSFETDTHGYIVFKKERGVESVTVLETVLGYLKPLGSRKICEGILYDLMALKYHGFTSTGLDKDLWFINVNTGKFHNIGLFFYLHEFSAKLCRAPKDVLEVIPQLKPKDNESLIIDLVKNTMIKLNQASGLKVDDFHKWLQGLNSNSLEMSLAESQVFNRSIVSVTTHGFNLEKYYTTISYS